MTTGTTDYIVSLEDQCNELKSRNRWLEGELSRLSAQRDDLVKLVHKICHKAINQKSTVDSWLAELALLTAKEQPAPQKGGS